MTKFIKLPSHVQEMIEAEVEEIRIKIIMSEEHLKPTSSHFLIEFSKELKEAKATAHFREMELIDQITGLRKEVEPITITEEWLSSNGFEKIPTISYRWYGTWEMDITFDLDDFTVRIGETWLDPKFEFVHEFQNLITGLKLTLTPFNHEPQS